MGNAQKGALAATAVQGALKVASTAAIDYGKYALGAAIGAFSSVFGIFISVGLAAYQLYDFFNSEPERPVPIPENMQIETGLTSEQLREAARKEIGIDSQKRFNIALAGASGTGKSSLINAFRGIYDDETDAAAVGIVETTGLNGVKPIADYPIKGTNAVLWDVMGAGTINCKADDEYFFKMKLYAFDFLLICFAGRLQDIDWKIACSAVKYNVPLAFVRNQSDFDIENLFKQEEIKARRAGKIIRNNGKLLQTF